jgi:hypothetical protein
VGSQLPTKESTSSPAKADTAVAAPGSVKKSQLQQSQMQVPPPPQQQQQQLTSTGHGHGMSSVNTSMSSITDFGDDLRAIAASSTLPVQTPVKGSQASIVSRPSPAQASATPVAGSQTVPVSSGSVSRNNHPTGGQSHSVVHTVDEFDELRRAVRPVTSRELSEAMQMLKYDIHKEVQAVIKEQIRLFSEAKVVLFILFSLDLTDSFVCRMILKNL